MAASGNDPTAKSLITLSSALLVIATVSASNILYKIAASDTRDDLQALSLLNVVAPMNPDKLRRDLKVTAVRARDWLAANQSALEKAQAAVRESLIAWLTDSSQGPPLIVSTGVGIGALSGKASASAMANMKDVIGFAAIELKRGPMQVPTAAQRPTEYLTSNSVAELIKRLSEMAEPTQLSVATSVSSLPSVELHNREDIGSLEEVRLESGKIRISFGPPRIAVQTDNPGKEFSVPATTADLEGPSLLVLSSHNGNTEFERLSDLSRDKPRLELLEYRYGFLPVDRAISIAGDALAEGYRTVSIFGFRFSPRRLPFAIAALCAAIVVMILIAVEVARRRKNEIDATTLGLFNILEHWSARLALWVALPSLSIFMAIPVGAVPRYELRWLFAVTLVVASFGAYSAFRAVALFKKHRHASPN